ncbi:MAG: OmpA family protein [Campylobacteraceae bacterium]|jgi:OOP family OmpA-OmpF porin|nr:OmpA family protein [Campylobacteraceae bacterium]
MKKVVLGVAASMVLAYAGSSEISVVVGGVEPIHSYRYNGHTTYGIRAGLGLETALIDQIELGYDYSSGVEYRPKDSSLKDESALHRAYLNIIKELEVVKSLKLYALGGIGYEMLQKDLPQRSRGFGQYGVGLKFYFTDNIAIRGEVRQGIEFSSPNRDNVFYSLGFVYSFGSKRQETTPIAVQDPVPTAEVQEEIPPQEQSIVSDEVEQPTLAAIVAEDAQGNIVIVEDIKEDTTENVNAEVTPLIQQNINFDFDSAQIKDNTKITLQSIANNLQSEGYLNVKVLVKGHTDATGGKFYNLKLSQIRANAVKKELADNGVAKDRVTAKGYGELEPIEPNSTKEGRAANRRAEIIFE